VKLDLERLPTLTARVAATEKSEVPDVSRLALEVAQAKTPKEANDIAHAEVMEFDVSSFPCLEIPPNETPILKYHITGVHLAELWEIIQLHSSDAPLTKYLRDVLHCSDITATPWIETDSGARAQHNSYTMPLPDDIPEVVARLINLPKVLSGTSVHRLSRNHGCVALHSHITTQGVPYSDRFYLQNVFTFQQHPDGGVEWCQWLETVWVKPLPWTHGFIQQLVQKKARSDAIYQAPMLASIIQEVSACHRR
jgi:hypothetical protein